MAKNDSLHKAKDAKNDEFYTRIEDVAEELRHYKCPLCVANGINTEYAFEDMEGDHILPWSKGGHTTDDNLQMLCKECNSAKSDN